MRLPSGTSEATPSWTPMRLVARDLNHRCCRPRSRCDLTGPKQTQSLSRLASTVDHCQRGSRQSALRQGRSFRGQTISVRHMSTSQVKCTYTRRLPCREIVGWPTPSPPERKGWGFSDPDTATRHTSPLLPNAGPRSKRFPARPQSMRDSVTHGWGRSRCRSARQPTGSLPRVEAHRVEGSPLR